MTVHPNNLSVIFSTFKTDLLSWLIAKLNLTILAHVILLSVLLLNNLNNQPH